MVQWSMVKGPSGQLCSKARVTRCPWPGEVLFNGQMSSGQMSWASGQVVKWSNEVARDDDVPRPGSLPTLPLTLAPPLPTLPLTLAPPLPTLPLTLAPPLPTLPLTLAPPRPTLPLTLAPPLPTLPPALAPPRARTTRWPQSRAVAPFPRSRCGRGLLPLRCGWGGGDPLLVAAGVATMWSIVKWSSGQVVGRGHQDSRVWLRGCLLNVVVGRRVGIWDN